MGSPTLILASVISQRVPRKAPEPPPGDEPEPDWLLKMREQAYHFDESPPPYYQMKAATNFHSNPSELRGALETSVSELTRKRAIFLLADLVDEKPDLKPTQLEKLSIIVSRLKGGIYRSYNVDRLKESVMEIYALRGRADELG